MSGHLGTRCGRGSTHSAPPCELYHLGSLPSTPGVKPASPAPIPPLPESLLGQVDPTSALLRTQYLAAPLLWLLPGAIQCSPWGRSQATHRPLLQRSTNISWWAQEFRCPLPPTRWAPVCGTYSDLTSDLRKGDCPKSYLSSQSGPEAT